MTDQPVDLPAPEMMETEVSIPPVLAAVKPKKAKGQAAEPVVPAPATFASAPAAPSIPTAAAPADTVSEEPTMATTIENMTGTATEKTQAHFADMNSRATDAMAKGAKLVSEMNGFTKENVEALVESGKLAIAGMQSMAQDRAAFVRKQFEDATAQARTVASVKSPTEFMKLQGDFMRQQFDAMMAETSRSTESMLKLAGEVVQPVANRVAVAVEKIKLAA